MLDLGRTRTKIRWRMAGDSRRN